jgi:hypothetical protein
MRVVMCGTLHVQAFKDYRIVLMSAMCQHDMQCRTISIAGFNGDDEMTDRGDSLAQFVGLDSQSQTVAQRIAKTDVVANISRGACSKDF